MAGIAIHSLRRRAASSPDTVHRPISRRQFFNLRFHRLLHPRNPNRLTLTPSPPYPLSPHRPHLANHIFALFISFFSSSAADDASSSYRLEAAALSLLLSMANADSTLRHSVESIDDGLVVALSFRPCVQARLWVLNNALGLRIGANLLVTVFLGFTKDPYPGMRRAALDGLSKAAYGGIAVGDVRIVEGYFSWAVELLGDAEDEVRAAAIRVVCS